MIGCDGRMNRRLVGMLRARLPDLRLDAVHDPRKPRGQRWPLETLLRTLLVGLMAGCKSLTEVEQLTATLSPVARKQLGIGRRVPDTTLRTLCCRLHSMALRGVLYQTVRAAQRRKALAPQGLPFGVVAMDGKATALSGHDPHCASYISTGKPGGKSGMLRTVTCALVSSRAKVVLDAVPHAHGGEQDSFEAAFLALVRTYGQLDLFRLVSYDAGACSKYNADLVRYHGYHYLFALKAGQPKLQGQAHWLLGSIPSYRAAAVTEDLLGGGRRVLRRLYLTEQMSGFHWDHLRTVLRVESKTIDATGKVIAYENRYFMSSLPPAALSDAQWLRVVREHWAVENQCHQTLDAVFEEDDHPWIEACPQGALSVLLLRRVALNLLALFRSVTQRSPRCRAMPWRNLLRTFWLALLTVTELQVAGLRTRALPAPT